MWRPQIERIVSRLVNDEAASDGAS